VQLDATSCRLGLRIVTAEDLGLTQVVEVFEGGAAAAEGNVHANDFILMVDGKDVRNIPHDDVLAILTATKTPKLLVGENIHLAELAASVPSDLGDELRSVTLHPESSPSGRLGLRIVTTESGETIVIEVRPDGAAAAAGSIFPGDRIVSINGHDVRQAPHETVLEEMTSTQAPVLVLAKGELPEEEDLVSEPEAVQEPEPEFFGRPSRCATMNRHPGESWGVRICTLAGGLGVLLTDKVGGSPASKCADLHINDIIVEINGHDVQDAGHEEVVRLLSSSDHVELRVVASVGERVAILNATEGLGIKVVSDEEMDNRVRVAELVAGGQAEQNGGVHAGDVIVSVNHIDMRGLGHGAVVGALKTSGADVVIGLDTDNSPIPTDSQV
jgi:C-terminal processing protease CtpA/Prc